MLRKQESITQLHGLYKIDRTWTFVTFVFTSENSSYISIQLSWEILSSYWRLRTSSKIEQKFKRFSRSVRFHNTICLIRQKIIVEETCFFFNQATKHAPWVINQKIMVKFGNWTVIQAFKISCERGSINRRWFCLCIKRDET